MLKTCKFRNLLIHFIFYICNICDCWSLGWVYMLKLNFGYRAYISPSHCSSAVNRYFQIQNKKCQLTYKKQWESPTGGGWGSWRVRVMVGLEVRVIVVLILHSFQTGLWSNHKPIKFCCLNGTKLWLFKPCLFPDYRWLSDLERTGISAFVSTCTQSEGVKLCLICT